MTDGARKVIAERWVREMGTRLLAAFGSATGGPDFTTVLSIARCILRCADAEEPGK